MRTGAKRSLDRRKEKKHALAEPGDVENSPRTASPAREAFKAFDVQKRRHIIQIPQTHSKELENETPYRTAHLSALHFKLSSVTGSDFLLERAIEDDNTASDLKLKNVCAKLSVQLSDRIDNTVNILDISKRRFIEAAIIAALDEADRVMEEVNIFENLPPAGEDE